MMVISKLIVVSPSAPVSEAVRFAFERAGAQASLFSAAAALADGRADGQARAQLCVVATDDAADAVALVEATRAALGPSPPPLLCLGPPALSAEAARKAGADEVVLAPVMARDLVTLSQLLVTTATPDGARTSSICEGQLSDYHSVYYLARAIALRGESAVLSLVRGLRRGELRFFRGEITSAHVGALHGLAALHQLLLWSRAHLELRTEHVIPRRQIPLSANEILADAERFVRELRAVLGPLLPAAVYELVRAEVEPYEDDIPQAVYRILLLFDGYRTMADVIEDSPYRVKETIRIARRLDELGWIEATATARDTRTVEDRLADELAEFSNARIGSVELEPISERPITPASLTPLTMSLSVELEPISERPITPVPGLADATPRRPAVDSPASRAPTAPSDIDDDVDGDGDGDGDADGDDGGDGDGEPAARDPLRDWSDVLPTEFITGFSPVVPSTAAAGEIGTLDGVAAATADAESTAGAADAAGAGAVDALDDAQCPRGDDEDAAATPAPSGSAALEPDAAQPSATPAAPVRVPRAATSGPVEVELAQPPATRSQEASAPGDADAATDDDDGTPPKPGGKKRLRSP